MAVSSRSIEEYLAFLRIEKGLAANSVQAYSTDLHQFRAYLAKIRSYWREATEEDVTGFLESLGGQALAPSTRSRKVASIRGFFAYLIDEGKADLPNTPVS
ncbi:MAG TPA: site-specific integrase, partial [Firmicutes bacterium]|nr:site-specific integrase [Bacillota bacterium]